MAYTMEEFAKLDLNNFKSDRQLRQKCGNNELLYHDKHYTKEGVWCSDCYYDELGRIIEEYPIGRFPGR